LKGELQKDLKDVFANDREKHIYKLNSENIAELDDDLKIPIFSSIIESKLKFSTVGIDILGSGSFLARFRSRYFDADIRNNSLIEIVESIDMLLDKIFKLKENLKIELPEYVMKAFVSLYLKSDNKPFKDNLLKIVSSYKSKMFFEEFECLYYKKQKLNEKHIIFNDYKTLMTATAWVDEKKIAPYEKKENINDIITKSEALISSIIKGGNEPNIYELINMSITSQETSSSRQPELTAMANSLWGNGWNHKFPSLVELLNGYIYALRNISIQDQNKNNNSYLFSEKIETKFLADIILQGDFETTDVKTRYDRRLFKLCESLLGEIPTSLSRIFDLMFNNGRSFDNSKKSYRSWKKDSVTKAKKKHME